MVTDRLTDTVYFSEWLLKDFPTITNDLCEKLHKHDCRYGFLCHTRDYWCRDYMPIQENDTKFIQYRYAPDYLSKAEDKKYVTDPSAPLACLGIQTIKTDLVIDGGNIIKCPDKVIMTEKVFHENKNIRRNELIGMLEQLFECEIVFLSWDRNETYGHADGITRWVNGNKVLLTAYEESRYFWRKFRNELERHFEVIAMKYATHSPTSDRKLSWAYINFLQTKHVIIVPTFNIAEDEQALKQIENAFPDYHERIETVDASRLICLGGGIHCASWNIKITHPLG